MRRNTGEPSAYLEAAQPLMELAPFVEAVGKLGIAITMGAALWYFILTPRKSHDGHRRSALMVPGWIHDETLADVERVRTFYEKMQQEREVEHDRRIQEWRGFRDEERTRRKDAELQREKLLEAVNGLAGDIQTLLAVANVAQGDGAAATAESGHARK